MAIGQRSLHNSQYTCVFCRTHLSAALGVSGLGSPETRRETTIHVYHRWGGATVAGGRTGSDTGAPDVHTSQLTSVSPGHPRRGLSPSPVSAARRQTDTTGAHVSPTPFEAAQSHHRADLPRSQPSGYSPLHAAAARVPSPHMLRTVLMVEPGGDGVYTEPCAPPKRHDTTGHRTERLSPGAGLSSPSTRHKDEGVHALIRTLGSAWHQ